MSFIISRISGNVPSAKYLGITITEKMYWVQHISDISSKSTEILGFLRRNLAFAPRTTKKVAYKTLVAYALNWSMQHLFGAHIVKFRFSKWRKYRSISVGEMVDELPGDQSSLLLFHKVHCGTMSIDNDTYLIPSHRSRFTRPSHNSQYCRPQTYTDPLKYSFSPKTIPHWNSLSSIVVPHWNSLSPTVVVAEITEYFNDSARFFSKFTFTLTSDNNHR